MGLEMVDRNERLAPPESERLAEGGADNQRNLEPRPRRRCHRRDVLFPEIAAGQHLRGQFRQQLQMRSCRHLGNDAAMRRMQGDLACDLLGQHAAVLADDRHRRLVTTRLDAEHATHSGSISPHEKGG